MNNNELAKEILKFVGGKENVSTLNHCATRLRMTLKDKSKADKQKVEELEGVLKVVESGGQFQIVIGNEVPYVHEEMNKLGNFTNDDSSDDSGEKVSMKAKIFDVISGSFQPLLGALAGSGMLKGLLIILVTAGVMSSEGGTYLILSAAGNAVFYFLPILLGITVSLKLKANPYVGAAIGAALLEPNFTALIGVESVHFLGIPIIPMDYSSSVFPIFIAICIYALLEKNLKKVIPKDVQMFLVPMISIIIMVPLTVMVFGPFGTYLSDGIYVIVTFLSGTSGILTGAALGAAWPFLTILGLHWGVVPIIIANLAAGGDPIAAMVASAVFAQIGVALGIFVKSKDKKDKSLAGSTLFPALIGGITEPILYGFIVRYRRTIKYMVISGVIGGAITGAFGVMQKSFVFPSLLAIPVNSPMVYYVIAIAVATACAFFMTVTFGYENKDEHKKEDDKSDMEKEKSIDKPKKIPLEKKIEISSPMSGKIVSLSKVNDEAFADESMGKGAAIIPEDGKVVAPFDGKLLVMFKTKHAIGLVSDEGVEILIHLGIDTVKLEGKHFESFAESGSMVKKGDLLVQFDIEAVKKEGYDVITPVIVTNSGQYLDVVAEEEKDILRGDTIITIL